jgi:hypothetical protein
MTKVVRLTDLDPDMQRVVLALIAADKAAKAAQPETVPTSPSKRRGTASDKETIHGHE